MTLNTSIQLANSARGLTYKQASKNRAAFPSPIPPTTTPPPPRKSHPLGSCLAQIWETGEKYAPCLQSETFKDVDFVKNTILCQSASCVCVCVCAFVCVCVWGGYVGCGIARANYSAVKM